MNLANKLTIFRIILVPLIVIAGYFTIDATFLGIPVTFWIMNLIFCIASITDKLDGYIARSRNQITTFGKFLDPLADKILVLATMCMLVEFGKIPAWIPIIVLAREFLVSGYRLIAAEKGGKVIAASFWGKLKTVTQMIAIIITLLDVHNFCDFFMGRIQNGNALEIGINIISSSLLIISTIATVFSGWDYMKNGKELFSDKK